MIYSQNDNDNTLKDTIDNENNIIINIIWLNKTAKSNIIFSIEDTLKKSNALKYLDDASHIIMELITNAIKARYLHTITIKILREQFKEFDDKIDNEEYLKDHKIMNEYSEIFKDDSTKKRLEELIQLENNLIKDIDNNLDSDIEKYSILFDYKNNSKKQFIIKFLIRKYKNNIEFEVINNTPLTMISKTRIDSKRLIFHEYYNKNLVDSFFLEQLDSSESAGFGLALCDLRLFNQQLDPNSHLIIYEKNNSTHSKLILPIK